MHCIRYTFIYMDTNLGLKCDDLQPLNKLFSPTYSPLIWKYLYLHISLWTLGLKCDEFYNPLDFFLDVLSFDNRSEELEESSIKRIAFLANNWAEETEKCERNKLIVNNFKFGNDQIQRGTFYTLFLL